MSKLTLISLAILIITSFSVFAGEKGDSTGKDIDAGREIKEMDKDLEEMPIKDDLNKEMGEEITDEKDTEEDA